LPENKEVFAMKAEIHPEYKEVTVSCSCGAHYKTMSTRFEDFTVEVCSNCHPFYTGKERAAEAKGRVERFRRKYAKN
jgi:large subunit ribosomal protein L31